MLQLRTKNMQVEGANNSGTATVARLNAQLQGKTNDIELLMSQRRELEKALENSKKESLEAEKRADERFQ